MTRKIGAVLPVAVNADGVPLCPQDGLAMVSDDDGQSWQCPIGKAQMEQMSDLMVRLIDAAVLPTEDDQ